ncbi:peptidoglycan-binding protein [Streptomyces sp. NPDC051320]|uniref:peptidoglycan-binding protein n=1 Tax=Streptomyces sp. NPDC051320 TaxID=3154644 RepID=UPI003428BA5F
MTLPVFEEKCEPARHRGRGGRADRRNPAPRAPSPKGRGHLRARRARQALVLATAAGMVLGGGAVAAAEPAPPTPAGASAPPSAAAEAPDATQQTADGPQPDPTRSPPAEQATTQKTPLSLPATTRSAIISRAERWVSARVPYSTSKHWSDGYRQDCSGYVSMAWGLKQNEWTGSLAPYGVRISKSDLRPGDILLFHNPANPKKGSHVTLFGGWTTSAHTYYKAYEQTPPYTRARSTPYAYWSNSSRYVAYRYRGLITGAGGSASSTAYPGKKYFGKGKKNAHVARLGKKLVARGGGRFFATGPGPSWSEGDRRATRAFQRAQGWSGANADGLPGPTTWKLLVTGKGKNIPAVKSDRGAVPAATGRIGTGHFGTGHFGAGHFGTGHFGAGHFGTGHFGTGHTEPGSSGAFGHRPADAGRRMFA